MDEMDGGAALDDVKLNDTNAETKEDETPQDDSKVEEKVEEEVEEKVNDKDDKVQKTEGKVEEKELEVKSGSENNDTSIKSHDGFERDRPKSVLKNKTPTPVITTSATPNDIGNPHRDRECCNIS